MPGGGTSPAAIRSAMDARQFDLVVIGSGPGGYKAAVTAVHLGAKVALVERALPGGTCLNQGCVPKKALMHLASMIEDITSLKGHGLVIGEVRGDFQAALEHKRRVVQGIRENFPLWLKRLGVRLYHGHARLRDAGTVEIDTVRDRTALEWVRADRVIIASGSRPREHPACPSDGQRVLTSRDFMLHLRALPRSVLCLGGGSIGTELGYLLHQFGSRVTIVERSGQLLCQGRIPERASRMLERKFRRLGVKVIHGCSLQAAEPEGQSMRITLTDGSQGIYDCVLVAIGREPASAGLGLEEVGVGTDDEGFVVANEYLETSVPGIYAVGDVKRGPMTANSALHDAKVAATNAFKGNQLRSNYHRVPFVLDSALEIAAVGLTEVQAEDAGFEPDVARINLSGSAKSRSRHDPEGFVEVVHDEETGQLLGGCIVGAEAGEQIQMITAACQSPRGLWFFSDINYSHPSWCEELGNAIDPYTSAFSKSGGPVFRPGIYAAWE